MVEILKSFSIVCVWLDQTVQTGIMHIVNALLTLRVIHKSTHIIRYWFTGTILVVQLIMTQRWWILNSNRMSPLKFIRTKHVYFLQCEPYGNPRLYHASSQDRCSLHQLSLLSPEVSLWAIDATLDDMIRRCVISVTVGEQLLDIYIYIYIIVKDDCH